MFGEKLIIGHTTRKLDEKGRIIIPNFTYVSPGDDLILEIIKRDNEYNLKLVAYKEYYKIVERFIKLRDNATTLEEYHRFNREIENICILLTSKLTVDSQKRLKFPKEIIEAIKFENNEVYQLDGLGTSLLIRKK